MHNAFEMESDDFTGGSLETAPILEAALQEHTGVETGDPGRKRLIYLVLTLPAMGTPLPTILVESVGLSRPFPTSYAAFAPSHFPFRNATSDPLFLVVWPSQQFFPPNHTGPGCKQRIGHEGFKFLFDRVRAVPVSWKGSPSSDRMIDF